MSVETAIGLALPDGVVVCGKINMLSQEGELTRVPVSVGQAHINNAFVFEWITESLDMDKEQITLQLSSVKAGETTPVDLFQLPVTEVPSIRSVLELGEAGEPSVHHLKGMMTPVHVTLRVCLTGEEVVDYRFVSVTARYIKNLDVGVWEATSSRLPGYRTQEFTCRPTSETLLCLTPCLSEVSTRTGAC